MRFRRSLTQTLLAVGGARRVFSPFTRARRPPVVREPLGDPLAAETARLMLDLSEQEGR